MGTNYYLVRQNQDPETGNFYYDSKLSSFDYDPKYIIHIGKSSMGWAFGLHVYPDKEIYNIDDWLNIFNKIIPAPFGDDGHDGDYNWVVKDEYGDTITLDKLLDVITKRFDYMDKSKLKERLQDGCRFSYVDYQGFEHFLYCNSADYDVNFNLLRRKIDTTHCVGRGEGTFDYIVGEFS